MALAVTVASGFGSPFNCVQLSGMGPFSGSRTLSNQQAPNMRIEIAVAAGIVLVVNDASSVNSSKDVTIRPLAATPGLPVFVPNWARVSGRTQIEESYAANLRALDQTRATALAALNAWRSGQQAAAGVIRITGYLKQQSWQFQGTSYTPTDPCRWSLSLQSFPPAGIDASMAAASSALTNWYNAQAIELTVNYNFFMNAQQNDVLDQLIALHPTVTWNNTVITGESVLPALAEVAALFLPAPVYRDEGMGGLYEFAEKFKFADPLPTRPMSLTEAKVFFDSKIPRAVKLVDDVIVAGLDEILVSEVRGLVGAICNVELVSALHRHMQLGVTADARAAFQAHVFSSPSYTQALSTMGDAGAVNGAFYVPFINALKDSSGLSRGTYIVCPSSSYWRVRDAFEHVFPVHKAAGIPAAPGTAAVVGAREKLYAQGLEPFLMCLARGGLVVGWPSDSLVPTYVANARAHGFNVLFLQHNAADVRAAAVRNYRDLLANGSSAVKEALRGINLDDYADSEAARSANMVELFNRLKLPFSFSSITVEALKGLVKRGFKPLGTV